jgi:hypothetical protein
LASQRFATLDAPSGYPRLNAPLAEEPSAAREIVALVGVELFRPSAWPAAFTLYGHDRVDKTFEHLGVVHVGAGEHYGERHASGVGQDVPLRSGSTSIYRIRTGPCGPLFAGTLELISQIFECEVHAS